MMHHPKSFIRKWLISVSYRPTSPSITRSLRNFTDFKSLQSMVAELISSSIPKTFGVLLDVVLSVTSLKWPQHFPLAWDWCWCPAFYTNNRRGYRVILCHHSSVKCPQMRSNYAFTHIWYDDVEILPISMSSFRLIGSVPILPGSRKSTIYGFTPEPLPIADLL